MYSVRQMHLFSLQDLMNMQDEAKYSAIFETMDLPKIYRALAKQSRLGAPDRQNYPAIFHAVIIGNLEGFTTYDALLRRVRHSEEFRYHCGFTGSDPLPNKSAFSRMFARLVRSNVVSSGIDQLLAQAIQEGFVDGTVAAIDSTHVHARDQYLSPEAAAKPRRSRRKKQNDAPKQPVLWDTEKPVEPPLPEEKPAPKKKGRKKKAEREQWLREKAEREAALPLMEKPVELMMQHSLEEMLEALPIEPAWGRKNDTRNNSFKWFGYKVHLAVDCKSQYILASLFSAGNMSDSRIAVPLIRLLKERCPMLPTKHLVMDAGYDYESVYKTARSIQTWALIDNNSCYAKPGEGEDSDFRPLCPQGHAYKYDSFDAKYETLKYVRPENSCKSCPLASEGVCQKVRKIKVQTNVRKYTVPARGSEAYTKLFNQRTAVERVNAYLKERFQLDNVRHRGGAKAKLHMELTCFLYTACKLTVDRMNRALQAVEKTA